MKNSLILLKELTPAELGLTKTHEKYIRLPNNFDYVEFFHQGAKQNGTVIDYTFDAINETPGINYGTKITLRFVYYINNTNQEKRIPSLGSLYTSNSVSDGDVVKFESRNIDGVFSYHIVFYKKGAILLSPNCVFYSEVNSDINNKSQNSIESNLPLQQIFYGAPGTGKSHEIKKQTKGQSVVRTTFHPDSDYSTFVGAYKPVKINNVGVLEKGKLIAELTKLKESGITYPCHRFACKYWESLKKLSRDETIKILVACGFTESMYVEVGKCVAVGEGESENNKSGAITYSFVPQAFTKAFVRAYELLEEGNQVFLVIEEINRGNCAQIFGDLFQLLDRDNDGYSKYAIKPDTDLENYLIETLGNKYDVDEGMKLPPNLHIWATMNTSDQSLFPIDSAFKRRWDWKYVPIKYDNKDWNIVLNDGAKVEWVELQKKLNELIYDATESEDKMIGDWFVKAKDNEIDEETLVGKIIFYLWNDVAKVDAGKLFNLDMKELKGKDRNVIFSDFYTASGHINSEVVKAWLINLEFKFDETLDNGKPIETKPKEIDKVTYSRPEYAGILQGIEEKCKENGFQYRYFDKTSANSIDIRFDKYPYNTLNVSVALDKTGTPSADVKLWIEATPKAIETRDILREKGAKEFFESLVTDESLSYEEMAKDAADDMNKVRGWRLRNTAITFAEANAKAEAEWLFGMITKIRERFADAL